METKKEYAGKLTRHAYAGLLCAPLGFLRWEMEKNSFGYHNKIARTGKSVPGF